MSSSLTALSSEQYVARHEAEFTFNGFLIFVALPSAELLLRRSAFAIFFVFVLLFLFYSPRFCFPLCFLDMPVGLPTVCFALA